MPNTIEEGIEREKSVLQSFFQEKLDLDFYDLKHTYAQFRLRAVDGIPVKSEIHMNFYNDKTYLPSDMRADYAGVLKIFIMGEIFHGKKTCIGSYSQQFSKTAFDGREKNRLSFISCMKEASSYKYFPYNSVSGVLRKVDDPDYANAKCMEHLGRSMEHPSLAQQVEAAALKAAKGHIRDISPSFSEHRLS